MNSAKRLNDYFCHVNPLGLAFDEFGFQGLTADNFMSAETTDFVRFNRLTFLRLSDCDLLFS